LHGIFGRPHLDLEPYLDLSGLDEVHEEVCLALGQIPLDYTGGSHRSMGIVPPSLRDEPWIDYGEVIRELDDAQFEVFRSLADDPASIPGGDASRRAELEFGEERDHPLSRRQMLWLEHRFGVYFPWKKYVELVPNRWWTEKANAEGKSFSRMARNFFPKTIALVQTLPFVAIGRCNVMGLSSNDFGTVHRDREPSPDSRELADPFITLCPGSDKRLFLWDEEARHKHFIDGRAYWFNDADYHGVDADPWFRYSIRVDGVFEPAFLERLARDHELP
jgi:hypothetical protein